MSWVANLVGSDVHEFYSQIGVELVNRGSNEAPVRCFANPGLHARDDQKASCSVNLVTGLWHCKGCGEAGNPYQAALAVGRSEEVAKEMSRRFGLFLEGVPQRNGVRRNGGARAAGPAKPKVRLPSEVQVRKWRHAMRDNEPVLNRLRELKAWSHYGIVRLGLGWDGERVVFPVRSAKLKLCGIVRYLPGGKPKTMALPGSKRDLFPEPEMIPRKYPLFIVEGEGDAVAMWSLGLRAVAVPGAGSWRKEWGQRFWNRSVMILADADAPGRELAQRVSAETGFPWKDLAPERDDGWDVGSLCVEAQAEGGTWQARQMLEALIV